eukprot:CAMPEP_0172600408 /NCGR_PEP_ID=MMETSP1068-20121228/20614_1 /TAXON_ID=35684 /ORGANISM="Pseudopedinella elastica, Strain CCMP716" /LENGTH=85 /DNA_ID=CAMNT_0013401079 /DNA_START=82 /DNA_END=336 /DNA_ORIENTATION=-
MARDNGMSQDRSTCPRNVKISTRGSEPWTSLECQLSTRNVTPRIPDNFNRKDERPRSTSRTELKGNSYAQTTKEILDATPLTREI